MNGANALIKTLVANDVTVCFANPGTSEMQFVAALDATPRMRSVLCLFEGVATGAADGYGRIAGKPASTLLHLGPGYGNGIANLHNARRAYTPIVNVVGDHATYHRHYDAPLNSDIATLVKPNSLWAQSVDSPDQVATLTARAVEASYGQPGGPVSLILPADAAWLPAADAIVVADIPSPAAPSAAQVAQVAEAVRSARSPVILLGGAACLADAVAQAARIAATGVRIFTDTFVPRQTRGAGHFLPERLPYFAEAALAALGDADLMVLANTAAPVAFFAYPDRPSVLVPQGCATLTLTSRSEDAVAGLAALADALSAPAQGAVQPLLLPPQAPTGPLDPAQIGVSIARHMPDHAILCDDGVTSSAPIAAATATARLHDVLALTGGSIGIGLPLAVGAAVAAPDRKVLSISGDGSAMYTVQALWTMAREQLDITVVIFANDSYRILNVEMDRTGAGEAGPSARKLLDLGDPAIDWVSLAGGMGVDAVRCDTAEDFDAAFAGAMARSGPFLIEARI